MVDRITSPLETDISTLNIFDGQTTWTDDIQTWVQENYILYWVTFFEFILYIVPQAVRYLWRVKVAYPELWSQQTYWYL